MRSLVLVALLCSACTTANPDLEVQPDSIDGGRPVDGAVRADSGFLPGADFGWPGQDFGNPSFDGGGNGNSCAGNCTCTSGCTRTCSVGCNLTCEGAECAFSSDSGNVTCQDQATCDVSFASGNILCEHST